ncbi:MAG: HD-GYP domain-containing protein [Calditrichia bacterium]
MSEERTVLIVEDNITYGEMLKEALEHFGYRVFLSYSSTGGMDVLKQIRIDIVLSDINMPGINGIELTRRLSEMYLDIPVVLLTGIHDLNIVRSALKMGASDYIFKPIKFEELPVVIERNLERKKLESTRLQENKADLLLKSLNALMRALDAKDPYTSGHSQRVVQLAMLMAQELELPEDERYLLQLAAFLHDIGKIGMPDSILHKADSLEDYELRKAKKHPVIGSQIIGEIEEFSEVASIVRHHHERYDGSGYPDGLKGEAIPFFSRILAILDAYEALISGRSYQKARNREDALKEIEANANSQFDPYLVEIFIRVIQKNNSDITTKEIEKKVLYNLSSTNGKDNHGKAV